MAQEPQKNSSALITVAIIGVIGTIIAATISVVGNYNVEKIRQGTELTRVALVFTPTFSAAMQGQQLETVLSDDFNSGNGSYDASLWDCRNDCDIDNIFLRDEALVLHRNQEGWSGLLSHSVWAYGALNSIEGRLRISTDSDSSNGWFGLDIHSACEISNVGAPYIQCNYGTAAGHDYLTNKVPINTNIWYTIRMDFGDENHVIKYFLDDVQIGEYLPPVKPDLARITLGIYSLKGVTGGLVNIDDVKVTLRK